LIAYTAARNVWAASVRPFWYDELCTAAVARATSLSALWNAFREAKDSNPPLFYLIEYVSKTFSSNEHVAYRLVSVAGFCCALWCVFAFVRRRNGSICALACSATLLLTPLYKPYAVEARPYSMVVACIAVALFCYQRAPRLLWTILFGVSLALAEALHFYALFGFVPFAVAEAATFVKTRRFRRGVRLALVLGVVPLALFWPVLRGFKDYYGAHFWAPATLVRTVSTYALFLKMFAPMAVAIVAILSIIALRGAVDDPEDSHSFRERWVAVALLGLPVAAFAAVKIAHGGLMERYLRPSSSLR
jgi:4-amino-4-deoxy-L-arabinose transferase-like glycosyltransferase